MADLVLDYSLLHDLAGSMRHLREQIQADVNEVNGRAVIGAHGEVTSDSIGSTTMFSALSAFYAACHTPFKDSMKHLQELADLLDSVAKAFFDVDADFAGKVNTGRLQAAVGQWQADKKGYERYLWLKDQTVTYQYWDENGVRQTATIPLWDPKTPPPKQPGNAPTSLDGPPGSPVTTTATVDENGQITSETSTVTTSNGLTYTETTSYTYIDNNGDGKTDVVDYTTTITHSDGSTETIVKDSNPDGSYVVSSTTTEGVTTTTVTPSPSNPEAYTSVTVDTDGETTTVEVVVNSDGTGTKTETGPKGTDVYTGDLSTGRWTLTSHTDPVTDDDYWYYVPV